MVAIDALEGRCVAVRGGGEEGEEGAQDERRARASPRGADPGGAVRAVTGK